MTAKDWSSDGRYIVFSTSRDIGGQGTTIWIMKPNGTGVRPLIPMPQEVGPGGLIIHRWPPRWSPDSQKVFYTQKEYIWKRVENTVHLIHKAHRYLICDKNGSTVKELNIPNHLECNGLTWMGKDGKNVIFGAFPVLIDAIQEPKPGSKPSHSGHIYKYDLETDQLTQLTQKTSNYHVADWISDDILPVSPIGKKKVTWGTVKQKNSE